MSMSELELLAPARRFRARRPPSDLVDGALWATGRFFALVRLGRRRASAHRHPAFAGRRTTWQLHADEVIRSAGFADLPLALAGELRDVRRT